MLYFMTMVLDTHYNGSATNEAQYPETDSSFIGSSWVWSVIMPAMIYFMFVMCKVAVFHITKERIESQLYSFLTWVTDGGEWSTSGSYRFTPRNGRRYKLNTRLNGLEIWYERRFREQVLPLLEFEPHIIQPVA